MKKSKLLVIIMSIIFAFVLVFAFAACTPTPYDDWHSQGAVGELSSEKVNEIRLVHIKQLRAEGFQYKSDRDNVSISMYCGTYNGVIVGLMCSNIVGAQYPAVVNEPCIVDGVLIGTSTPPCFYFAYYDPDEIEDETLAGKLTTIEEVYNDGYLTHDDLISISQEVARQNA